MVVEAVALCVALCYKSGLIALSDLSVPWFDLEDPTALDDCTALWELSESPSLVLLD